MRTRFYGPVDKQFGAKAGRAPAVSRLGRDPQSLAGLGGVRPPAVRYRGRRVTMPNAHSHQKLDADSLAAIRQRLDVHNLREILAIDNRGDI